MALEQSADKVVETDVLVVGGGMAGLFATMKAKEQGVDVTLVDKSYVGKSGQTPWAINFPSGGFRSGVGDYDLDSRIERVSKNGEYVNNREWTEIIFKDSYARYQDLVSWGAVLQKGEEDEVGRPVVRLDPKKTAVALREQTVKLGVKVMDRIMITELLKQDGKIVGAIGIPMGSYDLYIFKAKATVICTGAGGFKTLGWPISNLTTDGQAMAYRAGAEVAGKEFNDTHETSADHPGQERLSSSPPTVIIGRKSVAMHPGCKVVNAKGNEIPSQNLDMEFEVHAGRGPICADLGDGRRTPWLGGAAAGMASHTTEGICPVNTKCASSIPGLYGAGDSLCTMFAGAVFAPAGLLNAAVTGDKAGLGAAEYASQVEKPVMDDEELSRVKRIVLAPTERKGGFSPRWVTQVLQNLMVPYFIMYIKHGERMKAALTIVEFLRDYLVPKLFARDPHELRLAHETKNMVLNAEIVLRSSLFRTESRGTHYREDYPRRDDPNWLAWVKVKEEQGRMKLSKVPIPKEWWPDLSKPYDERYPARFPGE